MGFNTRIVSVISESTPVFYCSSSYINGEHYFLEIHQHFFLQYKQNFSSFAIYMIIYSRDHFKDFSTCINMN